MPKKKKKCNFLAKKAEKEYFDKIISSDGIMTNHKFWDKIGPALSENNNNFRSDIILKEVNELITDDNRLSDILHHQNINIVEISTGSAPPTLCNIDFLSKDTILEYINKIINN